MADARIIDGKALAADVRAGVKVGAARLKAAHGIVPGLAVVLVGTDPASEIHVRNKGKATREAGLASFEHRLSTEASEADVLAQVHALSSDDGIDGILVQLPLPPQVSEPRVIDAVDPAKDVDGLHVFNAGKLAAGRDGPVPCTPLGCLHVIRRYAGDLIGQKALVIGRSNLVGKPLAQLLLREHCTVTLAHSRTQDLADECRRADILVAAVGQPELVRGDWIKPGATVIDVGINRIAGENGASRLVGDVAFDEAVNVAGAITPVPGGIGPLTIAFLLRNTLTAACQRRGVDLDHA